MVPGMLYTRCMDAFLAQDIKDNRRASLSAKLVTALEMMSLGIEMKRESLIRMHPELSEEAIEQRLVQWLIYYD